jgi:hypothetical protein
VITDPYSYSTLAHGNHQRHDTASKLVLVTPSGTNSDRISNAAPASGRAHGHDDNTRLTEASALGYMGLSLNGELVTPGSSQCGIEVTLYIFLGKGSS